MPCYDPRHGYRSKRVNPQSGKRSIVFNRNDGFSDMPVSVPCGQCIGCRLERSRQWAMRCVHEAQMYQNNCFITLTYNAENLPKNGSLDKTVLQKFMKRLRKEHGEGIRFYACGEYGDQNARPHYHICLFNFDFPDKLPFTVNNGFRLYVSQSLARLWPYGFSTIGELNFETAAYTARYVTKKMTGEKAEQHYRVMDEETGEYWDLQPEFNLMSRRPGIGKLWLEKYVKDIYPYDFCVLRDKKLKPPKFYDNVFDKWDPQQMEKVRSRRKNVAKRRASSNTLMRLHTKEKIQKIKLKQLKRRLEND